MKHINTNFGLWNLINESEDKLSLTSEELEILVKNSPERIKELIEEGKLDPEYRWNIITRTCIRWGENDLLDWILPKVNFNKIETLIGMCYEYRNLEAVDLIIKHKKVDSSQIEKAILWIQHSPWVKSEKPMRPSFLPSSKLKGKFTQGRKQYTKSEVEDDIQDLRIRALQIPK